MNQPKKERFKTSVGGQALMEGIMMRGPKLICCAVRKPDGTIETKIDPVKNHGIWTGQQKAFYYGNMTQEELDERREKLHGLYFEGDAGLYADNLAAMDEVFAFCEAEGVRVRALWLPENPAVEPEPLDLELRELCREKCEAAGVEFYDMTDALGTECFYDTGHLDYDYGAVVFTEVLDKWLLS